MEINNNKIGSSTVEISKIVAPEWNQLATEDKNTLEKAGYTPSSSDLHQLTKSIKKITEEMDWEKPAEWIDIRSGCINNSVYFLVAHRTPTESSGVYSISEYQKFSVKATTSSGTYDIFIDGMKYKTVNSNTEELITWADLYTSGFLVGGFPVSSMTRSDGVVETNMITHVVRVSPTESSATISKIECNNNQDIRYHSGLMWAHYALSNEISLQSAFNHIYYSNGFNDGFFSAITAYNDTIYLSSDPYALQAFCVGHSAMQHIPTIVGKDGVEYNLGYTGAELTGTKPKVPFRLKNITASRAYVFLGSWANKVIATNCKINYENMTSSENSAYFIKGTLPTQYIGGTGYGVYMSRCSNIYPSFLDFSQNKGAPFIRVNGTSSYRADNIKGLVVSDEAPLNDATPPQLDVSYTGLKRPALRRLFKSMPYSVGYTKVGSPTIVDGIASGFSNSNYLDLSTLLSFATNTPFAYKVKFTTGVSNPGNNEALISSYNYDGGDRYTEIGWLTGTYTPRFRYNNKETNSAATITLNTTLAFSTTYTSEVIYDGSTLTISLYDASGQQLETKSEQNKAINITSSAVPKIGNNQAKTASFAGSIDLNNTYIKVNDVYWFKGLEAVSRVCNVTGALGAEDLTSSDIQILTDKGWTLTR